MGPTVYGAIIELYRSPSVPGVHNCTGVPPQLDEINPIGTSPPSASWMSRPVNQHTALNVFHAPPPSAFELAGSQFSLQDCPREQGWGAVNFGLS
mmetsp:Transcript_22166/g.31206  ORF Transcript_22166/g.31206 Transcript_22166/m.31206 type:complete len:95 (+) Transcript_22166:996-1280(+)